MSNISVVQPATFEARAVRPRKKVIFALGLVVAALGGIGLALLKETLDGSVDSSVETNGQSGALTLGSVPYLAQRQSVGNGNGNNGGKD